MLVVIVVLLVGFVLFIGLLVLLIVCGMVGIDYCYVLFVFFLVGGGLVMLVDFVVRMINLFFEIFFGLVIVLIGVLFLLI